MEPKKEPKKAAFVAAAVAGFPANGCLRGRSFLEPRQEPMKAAFVAAAVAGFPANECLRGRSFLEPKKEPKKAAFVAVNAAGYTPTGFNARPPFPGSTALPCARCAKRTAEQREKSGKMNALIFPDFSLCCFARELACRPYPNWRKQVCSPIQAGSPGGFFAQLSFPKESAYPPPLPITVFAFDQRTASDDR